MIQFIYINQIHFRLFKFDFVFLFITLLYCFVSKSAHSKDNVIEQTINSHFKQKWITYKLDSVRVTLRMMNLIWINSWVNGSKTQTSIMFVFIFCVEKL